jgi:hypothetical protein
MAIKIIKPGKLKNPKDTRRFFCLNCGCVFDADRGDYEAVTTRNQLDDEITHQAICPACHKWVRRSEPLDE